MKAATISYLTTRELRHGELAQIADLVGITPRGLRKWLAQERRGGPTRGAHRPRENTLTRRALWRVVRIWHELVRGHNGSRTLLAAALRAGISLTWDLAENIVRALKRKRVERKRRRIERERVRNEVLARDALWSCDESFLGRDPQGEWRALGLRETFAPRTLWLSVGPPACAEDLVHALTRAAQERGGWPLVISFDNGKINHSGLLERTLAEHQVIALYNLPHTPQHNPFVERMYCDFKLAIDPECMAVRCADPSQGHVCVLDPGAPETHRSARVCLREAWHALDHTPRHALGGFTPAEIDEVAPRADDCVQRARFYTDACAALARVAQQQISSRARRCAEREAIWSTLEVHSLVVRTRGGSQSSKRSKRNRFV